MHEYNLVNLDRIEGISRPDELEKLKQNIVKDLIVIIFSFHLTSTIIISSRTRS